MTDKLKEFLKKEKETFNNGDFYQLFQICPYNLVKELYQILKESNLNLNINSNDDGIHYYGFKVNMTRASSYLQVKNYDRKKNIYLYQWMSLNKFETDRSIAFKGSFLQALEKCFEIVYGCIPYLISDQTLNLFSEWVPIQLENGVSDVLTTQVCVDSFDPQKIKERGYVQTAKEELNSQLNDILKHFVNQDKLRKILYNYEINNGYVSFIANPGYIKINLNYDPAKEDEILSVIKNNISGPLTVTALNGSFIIRVNKKKFDQIKSRIESDFDIKL